MIAPGYLKVEIVNGYRYKYITVILIQLNPIKTCSCEFKWQITHAVGNQKSISVKKLRKANAHARWVLEFRVYELVHLEKLSYSCIILEHVGQQKIMQIYDQIYAVQKDKYYYCTVQKISWMCCLFLSRKYLIIFGMIFWLACSNMFNIYGFFFS